MDMCLDMLTCHIHVYRHVHRHVHGHTIFMDVCTDMSTGLATSSFGHVSRSKEQVYGDDLVVEGGGVRGLASSPQFH